MLVNLFATLAQVSAHDRFLHALFQKLTRGSRNQRGEGVGEGAAGHVLSSWKTKWVDRLTVLVDDEVEGSLAHCSCVCGTFFSVRSTSCRCTVISCIIFNLVRLDLVSSD